MLHCGSILPLGLKVFIILNDFSKMRIVLLARRASPILHYPLQNARPSFLMGPYCRLLVLMVRLVVVALHELIVDRLVQVIVLYWNLMDWNTFEINVFNWLVINNNVGGLIHASIVQVVQSFLFGYIVVVIVVYHSLGSMPFESLLSWIRSCLRLRSFLNAKMMTECICFVWIILLNLVQKKFRLW